MWIHALVVWFRFCLAEQDWHKLLAWCINCLVVWTQSHGKFYDWISFCIWSFSLWHPSRFEYSFRNKFGRKIRKRSYPLKLENTFTMWMFLWLNRGYSDKAVRNCSTPVLICSRNQSSNTKETYFRKHYIFLIAWFWSMPPYWINMWSSSFLLTAKMIQVWWSQHGGYSSWEIYCGYIGTRVHDIHRWSGPSSN